MFVNTARRRRQRERERDGVATPGRRSRSAGDNRVRRAAGPSSATLVRLDVSISFCSPSPSAPFFCFVFFLLLFLLRLLRSFRPASPSLLCSVSFSFILLFKRLAKKSKGSTRSANSRIGVDNPEKWPPPSKSPPIQLPNPPPTPPPPPPQVGGGVGRTGTQQIGGRLIRVIR